MPLVVQSHSAFTTSNGHTPHPRSAVSRNAALPRQHRARRPSAHTDAHASSINCFPTTSATLPPYSAAHILRPLTLRSGLPRGCGGEFEQVCTCVCRAHWRGFLDQRSSREGPRDWCIERGRAVQEKLQVGTCGYLLFPEND